MYVGADVGRGYVKVATDGDIVVFPSYVAPGRELALSGINRNGNSLEHLDVKVNKEHFFIGELARRHGGTREYQKDKVGHNNTLPLLLTGIALNMDTDFAEVKVVVGLPIVDYCTQAKDFEEAAKGVHEVNINGDKKNVVIGKNGIIAFPEGAGAVWHLLLDDKGKPADPQLGECTVGIIDIGWKTVNYVVLRKMQFDDSQSGTLREGLAEAFRPFATRMRQQYDLKDEELEELFIKEGQPELKAHARRINDLIRFHWPNYRIFDHIFIAGGGGKALFPFLEFEDVTPQLIKYAQTANARGFYKVARAHWNA